MRDPVNGAGWRHRAIAAASAALLLLACVAQAAADEGQAPALMDTLVSAGDHRLHLMTVGEGSPAVVLDVGFGDSPAGWQAVIDRIAAHTRVVSYERAGLGRSEPGPLPRTPERAAGELVEALRSAGIEPPCVFVGHSLGALNLLLLGARYPELAVGLLLVSPPPLAFLAGREFPELRAEADSLSARLDREAAAAEASSDPGVRAGAPRLRALASEHAMMFSTGAEQAGGIETLGDLPVTVIAAGNANPDFGAVAFRFQELWIAENARLAELSTRGRFLLARSGHRVHREAPDLIVREVIAMVDSVRAGAAE